jgi:PAS domain S-box-containing protein
MFKLLLSRLGFLILYEFFALALSLLLIYLNFQSTIELLVLLIVPVIYAAIYYPRYIYLSLITIAVAFSSLVIFLLSGNPSSSLKTLILLVIVTLILSEIIHRLVIKNQTEKEFISQVITSVGQGLTVSDSEANFTLINPSYAQMLGYTMEELLTKTPFDITYSDDLPILYSQKQKRLSGESSTYEVRVRKADGTLVPVSITGTPFKREGKVVGMIATITDLTAYKKVEEELRQAEARYRNLIEQIPAVTYICTTDLPVKTLYISPQVEQLLGYNPTVWLEKQNIWSESVYPADLEWVKEEVKKSQTNYSTFRGEYRILHRDGTVLWVQDECRPIFDENNRPLIFQGILVDITSFKKVSVEQLKTSKLESLGHLAGGIAHDFNNLLTAIIGSMTLIKLEVEANQEINQYIEYSEKAIARAKALTQQLLIFAKGGSPVKEPTKLNSLVEEATLFVLTDSSVKCVFDFAPNLWLVEADSGQISRVIQNIVLNALQAMPGGGTILVKVQNLTLETHLNPTLVGGNYIKISIQDTGSGIKPEHLPSIFDPYFSTKPNGSGLGLAVCYSIIKQHDGYIDVESTIGVGTTFNIYLPAKIVSPEEIKPVSAVTSTPKTLSDEVLIMDDDPLVRRPLKVMLMRLGYNVEEVDDGKKAIELYRTALEQGRKFSVVIMDLTIPGGMGGKEAVRYVLDIDPEAVVIVSSGYSDDPVMSRYRDYGFREVLPKPYDIKTLKATLERVSLLG